MKRRARTLLGLPVLAALSVPSTAQAATPLCWGAVPTMVGTAGPDVLVGRANVRDVIYAV